MPDPNAQIGAVVPVAMPALFGALGYVQAASLWHDNRPTVRSWRAARTTTKVLQCDRRWISSDLPSSTGRFK